MRKYFAILLVLMMVLAAACQSEPAQTQGAATDPAADAATEAPESGGTLVVGLEAMYPPFNWTQLDDSNGAVPIKDTQEFAGGYDVEIAKRIAEGLGKELVIQKIDWDGLEPALRSGTIDAIVAGMSPTEERKESIDFSDIYYKSEFILVMLKDGPYADATSLSDFSGATVTGQLNTSHYRVIDQIDGVNKDTAMGDFGAMRVALESGIIDAYVAERPEGISVTKANPRFTYVIPEPNFEAPIEEVSVAVGLKKGSELREAINEILAGISDDERKDLMDQALEMQPGQD